MNDDAYLSVKQAALWLNVSESTIYALSGLVD
jgi:hypothetical protein